MRLRLAILAISLDACAEASPFACNDASDCASAKSDGWCEEAGYCSFPADECPSGRRYGEHAPADLAGSCVPVDDGTGTGDPTVAGDAGSTAAGESSGAATGGSSPLEESSSLENTSPESTSLESTSLDDTGATTGSAGSSSDGSTTSTMIDVVYDAAIAVCTQDTVFDPAVCAEEAGVEALTVDLADNGGLISTGWLRFDFDDALAGATIVSMDLVVVVGSAMYDNSGSTGELWTTEPFDLAALMNGNPTTVELVGDDLGPVGLGDEIVWSLPVELFDSTTSLHFAIVPVATDGLDLLDATSDSPPRLRITAM